VGSGRFHTPLFISPSPKKKLFLSMKREWNIKYSEVTEFITLMFFGTEYVFQVFREMFAKELLTYLKCALSNHWRTFHVILPNWPAPNSIQPHWFVKGKWKITTLCVNLRNITKYFLKDPTNYNWSEPAEKLNSVQISYHKQCLLHIYLKLFEI
jgi:hypothetical protein